MKMNDIELQKYDWLRIKKNKIVTTKDLDGNENGRLIDILNRNDVIFSDRKDEFFQQFYMTTVGRHSFKGLHVHPFKQDTIFVPTGKITLVLYTEPVAQEQSESIALDMEKFIFIDMGEDSFLTVSYPSKYPHGFWGRANQSIIINYRYPAWEPDDIFQFDIKHNALISYLSNCYE